MPAVIPNDPGGLLAAASVSPPWKTITQDDGFPILSVDKPGWWWVHLGSVRGSDMLGLQSRCNAHSSP